MRHLSIERTDVWKKILDVDHHFLGDSVDYFNKLFSESHMESPPTSRRAPVDFWSQSLTMEWAPSTLEVEPTPRWQWWLVQAGTEYSFRGSQVFSKYCTT
ncbi:hypothetical protein O181_077119 [Austropuccinia psidii MF-1]|uniref:Uncharacterized protein n=1 Tax=Austropuccinia psidii MF-1 TaxID=1389203 RepID=A0A9Q3FDV9_9BASI|nr:hypothetical protein [Austropuccinia psidii MF-1]